jgi:uncharacterized protein YggU (UPF0235/DUF167 family)
MSTQQRSGSTLAVHLAQPRKARYAFAMTATPLSHLAHPGARIAVRVTPKASRERLTEEEGVIRAYVTVPPEDGKANVAVQKLLAKAVGLAKSRLVLVQGHKSRDKVFEIT